MMAAIKTLIKSRAAVITQLREEGRKEGSKAKIAHADQLQTIQDAEVRMYGAGIKEQAK
jgi:hypothetical protein